MKGWIERMRRDGTPRWLRLLPLLLAAAGLIWGGRCLGARLADCEAAIAALGLWSLPLFLALYVGLTLLVVPMTLFAMLAGAIFDLGTGIGLVLVGTLASSVAGFLIARHLGKRRCEAWLARYPRLAAVNRVAGRRGFRFMFLLRLTPINFTLLNYVLGISRVRFSDFLLACTGMFPMHAMLVYAGFVARQVLAEDGSGMSGLETGLMYGGLATALLAAVFIARFARRELREEEAFDATGAGR